ncbi:hypothetical protein LIER_40363 [Lithospermum erythrorhizon]|uniref:Uncharacterized protein n=1 Tax=Lithospermum erythrorhizon TaxID=34254 RepID=A0AAV3QTF2_LITER
MDIEMMNKDSQPNSRSLSTDGSNNSSCSYDGCLVFMIFLLIFGIFSGADYLGLSFSNDQDKNAPGYNINLVELEAYNFNVQDSEINTKASCWLKLSMNRKYSDLNYRRGIVSIFFGKNLLWSGTSEPLSDEVNVMKTLEATLNNETIDMNWISNVVSCNNVRLYLKNFTTLIGGPLNCRTRYDD